MTIQIVVYIIYNLNLFIPNKNILKNVYTDFFR